MATTHDTSALTVQSSDGTRIAYEAAGAGPVLILVDGALCFRSFGPSAQLAQLLQTDLTVYRYDRRGRGESGDTLPYAVDREIDDIDALIEVAGGRASLYGISSGGALALEAAASLGRRVERLAVYEIPYDASNDGISAWRRYRSELTEVLSAGRRGDAAELFMRLVGASDQGVQGMRQSPVWPVFEAVAPTLAYDAAALGADRTVPVQRAATISASTLVMDGGASRASMPFMAASAEELARVIPNARRQVLEDQGHEVDAKVLAPVLRDFMLS